MSINSLEKRVAAIENKMKITRIDPDYAAVLAFDCLSDTELGIIQEIFELKYAGFSDAEIRDEQLAEMTRIMEKWKHEQNRLMGITDGGDH
jgi:hypothetical protein